jgi:hypothetical protein
VPVFCTVLVKTSVPLALVEQPGFATPRRAESRHALVTLRLVKSSLLLVGPTAAGWPLGPMSTEPRAWSSVGNWKPCVG